MTDRFKGFIVTLAQDVREDDAEAIVRAVSMVKGVIDVRPVVAHPGDAINRQRLRRAVQSKLFSVLDDD